MCKNKSFLILVFTLCLLFFNGCGLDEYYVLDAPYVTNNSPSYSTAYDNKYFEFQTYEEYDGVEQYLQDNSAFQFLGTAVYYKIYNNYSTMQTQYSSINSLNSSTNASAAATKMIDTYGYKQLGLSTGTKTPLIKADGNNKRIYIRLSNYQETISSDFIAEVKQRDTDSDSWENLGKPRRNGNKLTFDFGRTEDNDNNAVPLSDEDDVKYSTSFSDDDKVVWYVDMYAVAVGQDSSYTQYYSKVLHLGSVSISTDSKDN